MRSDEDVTLAVSACAQLNCFPLRTHVRTVSRNHYARRGSACLCGDCEPACVQFNDLFFFFFFLRSGLADIEMDGPYALYGPCIFHIQAKQGRAASASTARMLRWDVG